MRKALLMGILAAVAVLGNATAAQAAPPSNDDIADAIVVTAVPFTDSVNTSEATYVATDTGCGPATVWYRFTPADSGFIEFHTAGSDYDTTLGLHTGEPSALNLVQCNDDSVYGLQSRIIAEVAAGETYYISAGHCCGAGEIGQVGPGGNLVFTVRVCPAAGDGGHRHGARGGTTTPPVSSRLPAQLPATSQRSRISTYGDAALQPKHCPGRLSYEHGVRSGGH